jgi:hypothetical protein
MRKQTTGMLCEVREVCDGEERDWRGVEKRREKRDEKTTTTNSKRRTDGCEPEGNGKKRVGNAQTQAKRHTSLNRHGFVATPSSTPKAAD